MAQNLENLENLETMFKSRQPVWGQVGQKIDRALSAEQVLQQGGLDWLVEQQPIYTEQGQLIPNCKANIRDSDSAVLGIVSDRYQVVQNSESFSFIDALLGEGVRFENVGSLQGGRRCFVLAKLPDRYIINDERIDPYLCFCNSHDGSLALTIFMTPIRIVCMNQLNLALKKASRNWSARHVGNMQYKLHEAHETLSLASAYMSELSKEINVLNRIKMNDSKVYSFIQELVPLPDNATDIQKKNVKQLHDDIITRYYEAPDLKGLEKNGFRFINAVSDHATHADPLRATANYQENLFMKTLDGHPTIDRAYSLVKSAA